MMKYASFPAMWMLLLALVNPAAAQERYQLDDEAMDWQQQTPHDPASPQGQLQNIRRTLAEGHARTAQRMAGDWIDRYPNHPRVVEAYLIRGDARRARNRHYEALFDYEMVIRRYPASELYPVAVERELEIAELFASGHRRHLWGMRIIRADSEAEELFILVQERVPGSDLGERANLLLGDFYFKRNRMREAADAYDAFLVNYPRSRHREHALLRLIQANLSTFKNPRLDPTGLIDAGERLKLYQREFPAAAEEFGTEQLLIQIDESMALKSLSSARWYERTGKRVSAAYMYRRTVRDYPQSEAAQQAIARLEAMGEPVVPAPPRARPRVEDEPSEPTS